MFLNQSSFSCLKLLREKKNCFNSIKFIIINSMQINNKTKLSTTKKKKLYLHGNCKKKANETVDYLNLLVNVDQLIK